MSEYKFDTLKVRAGYNPKEHNDSVAVPIYSTASYEIGDPERFLRIAAGDEAGNLYSRLTNPTVSVLENRLAELEGGSSAVAVSSGMAAITYAILAVAENGGRILTTEQLYGGSVYNVDTVLPKLGVKIDKIKNDSSLEEFEKNIKDDTKAIYVESISNPTAAIADIEGLAKIAHKHDIPLIVDNTLATPYLFNPIKHGADVVVHSATKAINGHGSTIGGVVIDSGNFNWSNGKFPQFNEPTIIAKDFNGKNRSFVEAFGKDAFSGKIRCDYLINFGAVLSPFDAYLILIGLETLSERVEKQLSNTKKIVEFLQTSNAVKWISYPSIEGSPYKSLADKYYPKGAGSVFSFGFNGTKEQIYKLIRSVNLFSFQANLGDARSLIVNVIDTTHGELNAEELEKAGIPEETIRLSIGLEDADDLIQDLKQAFEKALNLKPI